MIERYTVTDRESWLAMRRRDITASSAAALVGAHPYLTAFGLWAEKTGAIEPDGETTEAQERGIELEPLAVRRLAKLRPAWTVEQPAAYYRDPAARLGATPDCFAVDPERPGFGAIQIKSVEPSAFRRSWRNEAGETEPPMYAVIQAIVEAHLTGATWAAVAALVIGFGIDLHVVEVPLHSGIIDRVRAETAAFWRMVEAGQRPDPDYGRDSDLIAALYPTDDGTELDLSADNEALTLVEERSRLGNEATVIKKRQRELKGALLSKIGSASIVRLSDGSTLTAKTIHRHAYEVEATSYRDIRHRRRKDAA